MSRNWLDIVLRSVLGARLRQAVDLAVVHGYSHILTTCASGVDLYQAAGQERAERFGTVDFILSK